MTDKQKSTSITNFCLNCLCENDAIQLCAYEFQSRAFKAIFEMEQVMLCYICCRLARNAEKFIRNIVNNQFLLQRCDIETPATFETIKQPTNTSMCLTYVALESINIIGSDDKRVEDEQVASLEIKSEPEFIVKTEEINLDSLGVDDFADNIIAGSESSETSIKGEDDFPKEKTDSNGKKKDLQNIFKADNNIASFETSIIEEDDYFKDKIDSNGKNKGLQNFCKDSIMEILTISNEQCLEERAQKRLEEDYLNRPYRCDDCVKSFNYKDTFERHMELHSDRKGVYECDICKIRQPTEYAISQHKQIHYIRYRCRQCGLTRNDKRSMEEHYIAVHAQGQFVCRLCSKAYTRSRSLKKHMLRTHETREKVKCEHCDKAYTCKDALKQHIYKIHLAIYPSRPNKLKPHVCTECGESFSIPSMLKRHAVTHSDSRDFYCVECDKSFKTELMLKYHLKTTQSHADYSKLPYNCTQCEKRFPTKRDLERHTNRIHLNIKPHQCDRCDKSFFNKTTYKRHIALVHEKDPLAKLDRPRLPCPICDKTFLTKKILANHQRVHTGERPFKCVQCNADFSQNGSLHNHIKLVHLGLTREGTPKGQKNANKKLINKTKKLKRKTRN